jgi:hypothetical protein
MMEWLSEFWASITLIKVLIGVGTFIFSFTVSAISVGFVMVKIPENYFSSHYTHDFMPGKPWLVRWSVVIIKNLLGVVLILLGIVLSLPGIPGQGVLTILLGLIMLDIPGKRPLEARIIKRPKVLAAINNLRARYSKPPLLLD